MKTLFSGPMTFPAPGKAAAAAEILKNSIDLLDEHNIECAVVSTGGTPDMWSTDADLSLPNTEYRIGT